MTSACLRNLPRPFAALCNSLAGIEVLEEHFHDHTESAVVYPIGDSPLVLFRLEICCTCQLQHENV